jgi:hypothetical protein
MLNGQTVSTTATTATTATVPTQDQVDQESIQAYGDGFAMGRKGNPVLAAELGRKDGEKEFRALLRLSCNERTALRAKTKDLRQASAK